LEARPMEETIAAEAKAVQSQRWWLMKVGVMSMTSVASAVYQTKGLDEARPTAERREEEEAI
jgi:hypothetical protein